MRKINLLLVFTFFIFCSSFLQAAVITSTPAGGTWNVGGSWVGGVAPGAADDAVIAPTASVTVTAVASVRNVTVNGTLRTTAALTINAASVFTVSATGTYIHANTANPNTTIFNGTEAFNAASTVQINSWNAVTNPIVTAVSSNFGNLILNWNSASLWNNNGLGVTRTIQGNFTISNTIIAGTYLNSVNGNVTINIGGNFNVISDGYVELKRNSTGNMTFNVAGSTTISGANSYVIGVIGNNANSPGTLTFTTTNYTQSGGLFEGTVDGGAFGTAGGSVNFTASGAFVMSGGQHVGVDYPYGGNWGTSTYSMGSFSLTGGSIVFHTSVITDGRTISITVANDFSINFATAADFVVFSNLAGGGQNQIYNVNIGGNFSIAGNAAGVFKTKQDGTGNDIINVAGNFTISGGTNDFSYFNQVSSVQMTNTIATTIGGTVTISGGTTNFSNAATSHIDLTLGTASVNWNQTAGTMNLCNTNIKSGKTVTLNGTKMGDIRAARTITAETGSALYCSNFPVQGAGLFTLQSGTTLGIGNAGGITSAGATGNIQVTGTRTYNSASTYLYYEGQTPQATGNFTTTTTSGTYPSQVLNMVIDKTLPGDIVNLTNTTDVTGTLTLTDGILTSSVTPATAPWVRIPSTATVSPVGGSANSFVDGYIRRQGNSAFIFPTGDGGRWRRIEMTAPSISTEFEARYVAAAFANTTSMAIAPSTVLDHVSTTEHWYLSKPLGADGATAKVKLYWEDASSSGILKFDSLAVARWNGSAWEDANCYTGCPANWTSSQPERTYTGSATGTGAGTIQSNTVSNFSPFTFSSIGIYPLNPLPVELAVFDGYYKDNTDILNWTTLTEINNDYFTLERTFDGVNYEEVKRVDGAGNSTQPLDYTVIDDKQYSGAAYYRLKQTDYNGAFTYSRVIQITHGAKETIDLSPNPVSGPDLNVNLSTEIGGPCYIDILDVTGKQVASRIYESTEGANAFTLDVSGLGKGMYFITVRTNSDVKKIKFIRE